MPVVLGCILALVPLLITPGLLFYFDVTPKAAVVCFAAAVLVPWLALAKGIAPIWKFREGRWLCLLLAAQGVSLLASTALSRNAGFSAGGTNWRRLGLATWTAITLLTLVTAVLVSVKSRSKLVLMRAVSAAGLVTAVYGILQYFGWDPLLPAHVYHAGESVAAIVRPPGTLGHADYFGTYLAAVAFLSAGLARAEKSVAWKVLGVAAGLAAFGAIVLSGTRAALVGLAAGALLWLLWFRPRVRWLRAGAVLAAVAAAGLLFYSSSAGRQLRSRVRWSLEDPFGGARPLLWRDSLWMAVHRPAVGYGLETFAGEFPRFQSAALAREYPDFYHESPHNILLDTLTEQGLPGLAILFAGCVLGFGAAWRARKRDPAGAGALASALGAMLVAQQFTAFVATTALYTWVLIAVLVALCAPESAPPRRSWAAFAVVLAPAVLLAGYGARLCAADYHLARARYDLETSHGLRRAIGEYEAARRWQPAGEGSDLWCSRFLTRYAQDTGVPAERLLAWQTANEAARRATQTAGDRQNAWYNLAAFYASQNDLGDTESALRAALACAPNWFKPHWMLAQVLYAAGHTAQARSEALLACRLDGGKHAEVARTLENIH